MQVDPLTNLVHATFDEAETVFARLRQDHAALVVEAAKTLHAALTRGNQILIAGNGGSAADSLHWAAEFVGRFVKERAALPVMSLAANPAVLTAIGNDYGFERVFERQVRAHGRPGDILILVSTSGRSPNVLAAARAARELAMRTVCLTGQGGRELADLCDIALLAPSVTTARVQECHYLFGHLLCEIADYLGEETVPAPGSNLTAQAKLMDWTTLERQRERWQEDGRKVVWTNGCFDLLHAGHIRSLTTAKSFGDVLVVGLNSDASVRELKGPKRPIMAADERAQVLSALSCVDAVVVFEGPTPEESLRRLRPDIHCKGAEYAPPHGKPIPEAAVVEAYGGKVKFLPMLPGISTTDVVKRVQEK